MFEFLLSIKIRGCLYFTINIRHVRISNYLAWKATQVSSITQITSSLLIKQTSGVSVTFAEQEIRG